MGRRHLSGLLRAGFRVVALDPRPSGAEAAIHILETARFDKKLFHWVQEIPPEAFDVAIFSETAPYRLQNVSHFLEVATTKKLLLEKPLTSNPSELPAYRS